MNMTVKYYFQDTIFYNEDGKSSSGEMDQTSNMRIGKKHDGKVAMRKRSSNFLTNRLTL